MAKAKDRDGAAALHEWCLSRLADYNSAAFRDPMATGVRQLALDLLDRSDADSASLDALVKRISDRALRDRAGRLGVSNPAGDWRKIVEAGLAPIKTASFDVIKDAL